MEHGVFKTDDMTLATVLAIKGYPYSLLKLSSTRAIWRFTYAEAQEEDFDTLVDAYRDYEYEIEPREFVLRLADVRRELYERMRQPVLDTPASAA